MDKRDRVLLTKILEEANKIDKFINGMDCDDFLNNDIIQRAVCMTLINIGEKIKLLSNDIKQENHHVPWKAISRLRDVTAHGYDTLRMDFIWETISETLPRLRIQINDIITKN